MPDSITDPAEIQGHNYEVKSGNALRVFLPALFWHTVGGELGVTKIVALPNKGNWGRGKRFDGRVTE